MAPDVTLFLWNTGMIYMEPTQLGWRPLKDSWMATLPEHITLQDREMLEALFLWLLQESLEFFRKNCKEAVYTGPIQVRDSFFDHSPYPTVTSFGFGVVGCVLEGKCDCVPVFPSSFV